MTSSALKLASGSLLWDESFECCGPVMVLLLLSLVSGVSRGDGDGDGDGICEGKLESSIKVGPAVIDLPLINECK